MEDPPGLLGTRWESAASGYGAAFARRVAAGEDVDGEARLADAMLPRGSRVLDAGCGMGRVGAALRGAGHDAVGVDLDAALLDQSRSTYPSFPVVRQRLDLLTADDLAAQGLPWDYDLVVCVGNVMTFLAPDTEVEVLRRLAAVLAPGGRMLLGLSTVADKPAMRRYSAEQVSEDAAAAGLAVQSRFSSYELAPFDPAAGYLVAILGRPEDGVTASSGGR